MKGKGKAVDGNGKSDVLRIEHLNYKVRTYLLYACSLHELMSSQRVSVGMKLLAQIISTHPLGLIVSLPNQLVGHVPITQVSSELTQLLETMDMDDVEGSESEDEGKPSKVPDLFEIFQLEQYVRCIVTAVHAAGSTEGVSGIGRGRDEVEKASRRVELSLLPEQVNEGVAKADLKQGFVSQSYPKLNWNFLSLTPRVDHVGGCQKHRGPRIYPQPWNSRRIRILVLQGRSKSLQQLLKITHRPNTRRFHFEIIE